MANYIYRTAGPTFTNTYKNTSAANSCGWEEWKYTDGSRRLIRKVWNWRNDWAASERDRWTWTLPNDSNGNGPTGFSSLPTFFTSCKDDTITFGGSGVASYISLISYNTTSSITMWIHRQGNTGAKNVYGTYMITFEGYW